MFNKTAKTWLVILAVPAFACAVYARQVYLQVTHDLSVWKGGGMGMFAGIGAPHHRFLKIRVTDPLGQEIITTRLRPDQQRLMARVRSEPTESNFSRLAESLLTTQWTLRRETIAGHRIDSKGNQLGLQPRPHVLIVPAENTDRLALGGTWRPARVTIEYWKIGYDIETKKLFATHDRTFIRDRSDGSG